VSPLGDKAYIAAITCKHGASPTKSTPCSPASSTKQLVTYQGVCPICQRDTSLLPQCRADNFLGTQLPSETRDLAEGLDASLRKAYALCFRVDLLNSKGT